MDTHTVMTDVLRSQADRHVRRNLHLAKGIQHPVMLLDGRIGREVEMILAWDSVIEGYVIEMDGARIVLNPQERSQAQARYEYAQRPTALVIPFPGQPRRAPLSPEIGRLFPGVGS